MLDITGKTAPRKDRERLEEVAEGSVVPPSLRSVKKRFNMHMPGMD